MRRMVRLLTLSAAFLLVATSALALGTASGTTISNTAELDYYDANNNLYEDSSTVTTKVAQLYLVDVDASVTSGSVTNDDSASDTVYYPFTVTNDGNGADIFDLAVTLQTGWAATSVTLYSDVDLSGSFTPGDAIFDYTTSDVNLGADAVGYFILAIEGPTYSDASAPTTPLGANHQSVYRVTATSTLDPAFTPASDFVDFTTSILAPNIVMTFNHALTGDVNSNGLVDPGDTITFTATVSNVGNWASGQIDWATTVSAGLTYGGDLAATIGTLDDTGDPDLEVSITSLAAGGTSTITFTATVNAGQIGNVTVTAAADTTVEGTLDENNDKSTTVLINNTFSVNVTPDTPEAQYATPGDTGITYTVTVTNNGNTADDYNLIVNDPAGLFTWTLYTDMGLSAPAGATTGTIAAGATSTYYLAHDVPAGTPDTTSEAATVTATSINDPAAVPASDTSEAMTTTVRAPVLTINKTVSDDPVVPGQVITYTITVTNTGTGAASSFNITDIVPANTTFNSTATGPSYNGTNYTGTIYGNYGAAATTALDAGANSDGASYDSGTNTITWGSDGLTLTLDPAGGAQTQYT
ncbi:MAG: hypothetical protein C0609_03955, partial [Deltaproteobacteria bacterium]